MLMLNAKKNVWEEIIFPSLLLYSYLSTLSGQALNELSKDKPANKQVEAHVNQFRQTLTNVETELAKQINYLTQVSTGK